MIICYLIGLIIAAILMGIIFYEKGMNEDEFSGDIVCYVFSLFSWIAVFIILLAKLYKRMSHDKT